MDVPVKLAFQNEWKMVACDILMPAHPTPAHTQTHTHTSRRDLREFALPISLFPLQPTSAVSSTRIIQTTQRHIYLFRLDRLYYFKSKAYKKYTSALPKWCTLHSFNSLFSLFVFKSFIKDSPSLLNKDSIDFPFLPYIKYFHTYSYMKSFKLLFLFYIYEKKRSIVLKGDERGVKAHFFKACTVIDFNGLIGN